MKSSIEKKDKMKDPIEQIIKEANIDAKQAQEFKPEALVLSIMEVEEAIERAFIAGQELKAKEVKEIIKIGYCEGMLDARDTGGSLIKVKEVRSGKEYPLSIKIATEKYLIANNNTN